MNKYSLVFLLLLFSLTTFSFGRPGDLDLTFNGNGTNRTGFGNAGVNGSAKAFARQDDGKYVVAGHCVDGPGMPNGSIAICLVRFESSGMLDTGFGQNGRVITPMDGQFLNTANSVEIATDGKILIGGEERSNTNIRPVIIRYNADGSLDQTFGIGGKANFPKPAFSYQPIYDIAIQLDGKVLGTGSVSNGGVGQTLIVRLNETGTLDEIFGNGGVVVTDFGTPGSSSVGKSISVQSDGNIVSASTFTTAGVKGFAIVRLLPSGAPDPSFGTRDGKAFVQFGTADIEAQSVEIHPDGKIFVAGNARASDVSSIALARLYANGTLDTSFDSDGKVTTHIPGMLASGATVQPNGSVLVTGTNETNGRDLVLVKYRSDGKLDQFFNHGGIVRLDTANNTFGMAVIAQPDGRIAVAGVNFEATGARPGGMAVFRFGENGELDLSYGDSGISTASVGNEKSEAADIALQSDGKILVAGTSGNYPYERAVLARFNTDGVLDSTFGNDGKVVIDTGSEQSRICAISILADGKILIAGDRAGDFRIFLARLDSDGKLDTTFGSNGIVITQSNALASSMIVQPDGRIVVSGSRSISVISSFLLLRFAPNGTLDPSFGENGVQTIHFEPLTAVTAALALQNDGKVVVCGFVATADYRAFDAVIVRLKTDGMLDESFGIGGKVIRDFENGDDIYYSAAIQSDGKIVVGGVSGVASGASFSTVVRHNEDGSIDTTFGLSGRSVVPLGLHGQIRSILLQPNGKIMAVGHSSRYGSMDFDVMRFNPNGSLDVLGFGINGIVQVDIAESYDLGRSVTLDSNGRIVVSGVGGGLFGIARLNGGELNSAYSVSGRVLDTNGNPIRRATITVTDHTGGEHTRISNFFGHYNFSAIPAGQITVLARAKRHSFQPVIFDLSSAVTGLDLVSDPNN
jgi:uncharacterized delta-60 repeat protein